MAIYSGIGRLGRDVEIRKTQQGETVATLSLAVTYGRKGQDGKQPTQWVRGSLWGKQGESLQQWLTKGSVWEFAIDDLHQESFTKQDGTVGTTLEGRVIKIGFPPTQSRQDDSGGQSSAQAPQGQQRSAPPPPPRQAPQQHGGGGNRDSFEDDDIPFAPFCARAAHLAFG